LFLPITVVGHEIEGKGLENMSIDWLLELERNIENGREFFACPGVGRNQWIVGKTAQELLKHAKRAADQKKMPVNIVRIISKSEAVAGDLFLVPTQIGETGPRGEPQIQWSPMETREAAENLRDVRHGPSPFFGMQVEQTVQPETPA
jgi:hypothetical protein